MNSVNAAIGIQLRRLDAWNNSREKAAKMYDKSLEGVGDLVHRQKVSASIEPDIISMLFAVNAVTSLKVGWNLKELDVAFTTFEFISNQSTRKCSGTKKALIKGSNSKTYFVFRYIGKNRNRRQVLQSSSAFG